MEGSSRGGGRTIRYDFSREGEGRLKDEVEAKLLEFTGYTDDVLADYVIVLVKNGKRKEVAEQDLNESSLPVEAVATKPLLIESAKGNNVKLEDQNVSLLVDAETMQERSMKEAGSRRKRQWKGLTREELESPPLRVSEFDNSRPEDHSAHSSISNVEKGHSHYKEHYEKVQKKNPPDNRKRVTPNMKIDAPRRLLQSAFREALGPLRSSDSLRSEPALKRLRSVVSSDSSTDKFSQAKVNRSASKVAASMATAMKAAAEAAYDTSKARPVRNVLNGLGDGTHTEGPGRAIGIGSPHSKEPYSDYDGDSDGGLGPVHESGHPDTFQFNAYHNEAVMNLDRDEAVSGCASDHDAFNDADHDRQRFMGINETSYSENKEDNSLMVQYTVAPKPDEVPRRTRLKDKSDVVMPKPAHKIVNISVNVNTWKPPHFESASEVSKMENTSLQDRGAFAFKSGVRLVQENNTVTGDRSERPRVDVHEEQTAVTSIPGSYSAVRPFDDVESRSIFVSNVHFGATKDLLSTHFNKFGEVQKVIIVMDAATGQPTGSACVEFVRKESAELALALNGTSFMSRILKVVPRSSATQRDAPVMSWSRLPRPSPYSSRLLLCGPYARGAPGMYGRPTLKVGPRSLQWKRESPSTPVGSTIGTPTVGTPLSTTPRRALTYVRSESKPANGNSCPA
ncbi:Polyadenylate-binding protein 2-A [Nymphaea thermarum]|nr:Polyadenylate-binding protein 2-A [Nymphaea thermarum]